MKQGTFSLNVETVLNIVVGQRGGDSVEVKGGQSTNLTAAQLELSVEDNAGTWEGGGGVRLMGITGWMVRWVPLAPVV